jgi:hypothetical protein
MLTEHCPNARGHVAGIPGPAVSGSSRDHYHIGRD